MLVFLTVLVLRINLSELSLHYFKLTIVVTLFLLSKLLHFLFLSFEQLLIKLLLGKSRNSLHLPFVEFGFSISHFSLESLSVFRLVR